MRVNRKCAARGEKTGRRSTRLQVSRLLLLIQNPAHATIIRFLQIVLQQVQVLSRGVGRRMAQVLLKHPQRASVLEHVDGKRMPEQMGMHMLVESPAEFAEEGSERVDVHALARAGAALNCKQGRLRIG